MTRDRLHFAMPRPVPQGRFRRVPPVMFLSLLAALELDPAATHVMVHSVGGYTTNLSLEDFTRPENLLAHTFGGEPLERRIKAFVDAHEGRRAVAEVPRHITVRRFVHGDGEQHRHSGNEAAAKADNGGKQQKSDDQNANGTKIGRLWRLSILPQARKNREQPQQDEAACDHFRHDGRADPIGGDAG